MKRRNARDARQLVILTGLSGSGKSTVLKTFEDLGFYCVDNLPVALIPTFSELHMQAGGEIQRAALLVDAREGGQLEKLPAILRQLRGENPATLVFIEASEDALLRRFSETRRPHPLAVNQPAIEGIREEREALQPIRKMADLILDTSQYTVHELRDYIQEHYDLRSAASSMVVSVMSFGYKYGIPSEADLVFDLRFLPNPNFVPSLKPLTGGDAAVVRYLLRDPETKAFLARLKAFLSYLIPRYVREGKSYLTIAIGCTGGRHRSVMIANALGDALSGRDYAVKVRHRDVKLG